MYRVNKRSNKRCTGTSDDNHCVPSNRADKMLLTNNNNKPTTWST